MLFQKDFFNNVFVQYFLNTPQINNINIIVQQIIN